MARPTSLDSGFSAGLAIALTCSEDPMLKIQRTANGDVVFTVSGRLEAHNISELSTVLAAEQSGPPRDVDLKDLVLVDGDAVRFLCACANDSIVLRNCPPYIRAWMAREGENSHDLAGRS